MKIVQLITAERRTVKLDNGYFIKVNPGEEMLVNDHEAASFVAGGAFVVVKDMPDTPGIALVADGIGPEIISLPKKENTKAEPAPIKKQKQSKGRK